VVGRPFLLEDVLNNNADELLAELLADDNTERLKARLAREEPTLT
jgi:hypothetical protein